jgi:hypothetical protein
MVKVIHPPKIYFVYWEFSFNYVPITDGYEVVTKLMINVKRIHFITKVTG